MTKLDTLLLELEKLDGERTFGIWRNTDDHYPKILVSVSDKLDSRFYLENETELEICNFGDHWCLNDQKEYDDAAFIVKAVNSNKVLREVIKIQREALAHECYCTPDYTGIVCVCGPCQALEAAEKVCEEA